MADKVEPENFEVLMSNTLADIASTLKQAVVSYGPDVVDLTLMAYRIEAATQLIVGVAFTIIPFISIWLAMYLIRLTHDGWVKECDGEMFGRVFGLLALAFVGVGFAIAGLCRLFSVVLWAAAFGHPELMIATKALKAAGLL